MRHSGHAVNDSTVKVNDMNSEIVSSDFKVKQQGSIENFEIEAGFHSLTGPRLKNDDSAVLSNIIDAYAIADGIGGAPYGDAASRSACVAAVRACECGDSAEQAFYCGNTAAIKETTVYLDSPDSGTTLVVMKIESGSLSCAYVGDTAVYLVRNGVINRLTYSGRIGNSNVLESAAGYTEHLDCHHAGETLEENDVIIACTDGVWATLDSSDMANISDSSKPAASIAQDLVEAAEKTTDDNITAVVLVVRKSERPVMNPDITTEIPVICIENE